MYNIQMTKMFNVYTWLFGAIVVNDFSLVGKRAFSHLGKQSYRENHICSLQILESLMYFKERWAYICKLPWLMSYWEETKFKLKSCIVSTLNIVVTLSHNLLNTIFSCCIDIVLFYVDKIKYKTAYQNIRNRTIRI